LKVSIVTISYNQAQFLEQCIESVLQQSYPDIEYIVVDPGSTDGSRGIIERYRSEISKIIFEPDAGPADGLNKGFKFASGEIFGFINSDDYYLPSAISKTVSFILENPDVDVVAGNAHVINPYNVILRYTYSDRYSLLACAYGYSILIQPSTFFRAKSFHKVQGFNTDNHLNWDSELFIDMKLSGATFSRINEYLSAFRISETSITGSGKLEAERNAQMDRLFRKIMGRNQIFTDKYFGNIFRLYRYLTNPRDFLQRIINGPIYARYAYFHKIS